MLPVGQFCMLTGGMNSSCYFLHSNAFIFHFYHLYYAALLGSTTLHDSLRSFHESLNSDIIRSIFLPSTSILCPRGICVFDKRKMLLLFCSSLTDCKGHGIQVSMSPYDMYLMAVVV